MAGEGMAPVARVAGLVTGSFTYSRSPRQGAYSKVNAKRVTHGAEMLAYVQA